MKTLIAVLTIALSFAGTAWAEHTGETVKREVNERAAQGDPSQYIADRLAITTDRVSTLRGQYPDADWGELAGRFAYAKEVAERGDTKYKTTEEAMDEISRLRKDNKSWEDVDHRLREGGAAATSSGEASEEAAQLRQIQQDIDNRAAAVDDEKQAQELADQFDVSRDTITGLRERYQTKGWGEITILLAVADALHDEDGTSMDEALRRAESARGQQSAGWDAVARQLDVNLHTVVDSSRQIRQGLMA